MDEHDGFIVNIFLFRNADAGLANLQASTMSVYGMLEWLVHLQ